MRYPGLAPNRAVAAARGVPVSAVRSTGQRRCSAGARARWPTCNDGHAAPGPPNSG